MSKAFKPLILLMTFITILTFRISASDTTEINRLIENAKALDGKEVTIQGEAIGDIMNRGSYSWVNINDGTNVIGVWVKKDDANKISYMGSYKNKGDTIRITGIFHRACAEHGGESDVHSVNFNIEKKGYETGEPLTGMRLSVTVLFAVLALAVTGIYFKIFKNKL